MTTFLQHQCFVGGGGGRGSDETSVMDLSKIVKNQYSIFGITIVIVSYKLVHGMVAGSVGGLNIFSQILCG